MVAAVRDAGSAPKTVTPDQNEAAGTDGCGNGWGAQVGVPVGERRATRSGVRAASVPFSLWSAGPGLGSPAFSVPGSSFQLL